jgi:rhodanese-related sulfurtransferase
MPDPFAQPDSEVSAEQAIRASADGVLLLDVREQDEWDRGHAPGALLMPMSELQQRFEELPLDAPILVICHIGGRSQLAANGLQRLGYDAVSVAGGMVAWSRVGGEVVNDGPGPASVD